MKLGGRKRYKGKFLAFFIIILIIFLLGFYIEHQLKPTIRSVAETKANLIATEVINKAIYEEVLQNVTYSDLVNVQKDNAGRIMLIQADTIRISKLISKTNLEIVEALSNLNQEVFSVPLGQVTGSYLLATYGPPIKVRIYPIGEINVQLYQDFDEAGINQTRHILYIDTKVAVKVAVPMVTEKITVSSRTPIAETIIVGTVPNTMVRFEGGESFLKGSLYNGLVP